MIKDFFIWHQGFHEAIAEAVNDPAVEKITLYAGEEWEIATNWHSAKYYRKLQDFAAFDRAQDRFAVVAVQLPGGRPALASQLSCRCATTTPIPAWLTPQRQKCHI